jgi:hypothetical protein
MSEPQLSTWKHTCHWFTVSKWLFNRIRKWSKVLNEALTFEKNPCCDVIMLHKNETISRDFSGANLETGYFSSSLPLTRSQKTISEY